MRIWNDSRRWWIDGIEEMKRWLTGEIEREGISAEIDLIFVDEQRMIDLNRNYFDLEEVTDVIAFDLHSDPGEEPALPDDADGVELPCGEVYVCLDRARVQAVEYSEALEREIGRLALHGLLHLAGWSDQGDEERKAMTAREDEGLDRIPLESGEIPWSVSSSSSQHGGNE